MQTVAQPTEIRPSKVALLGEFYVLMEPYVNHMIENMLIKLGIEVKKFVYTGNWAQSKTLLQILGLYNEEKECLDQARPYLNYHVGGDGLKSVGSALWCARNGYDGIIHIYPSGCMPEVVAQYALKNIANDYNLPLLSLSLDEHSSDVGIVTRVEAFADCIKRKQ
jgi:predicted nucleotide-binding protein (sugar kinase/HSP70/actin superfamily)